MRKKSQDIEKALEMYLSVMKTAIKTGKLTKFQGEVIARCITAIEYQHMGIAKELGLWEFKKKIKDEDDPKSNK